MADPKLTVVLDAEDRGSSKVKRWESATIRAVGAVTAALAAIGVIGFPVVAAAEFQKQMLQVKKTTDLNAESVQELAQGLIDLSKTTNKTAVDLAKIAEAGGRMGIADQGTAALLEFTTQVSTLSTALDMEADEVATSMGKLVTIFNLSLEEFSKAGAVINQLDNQSTATAREIFDVMRRIGNIGGSLRFDQSAALAALAIDIGLTAETAGTTITKVFADMKAQARAFADFMGMTTQEWVSVVEKDGIAALRAYVTRLNQMPAEVAAATKATLTGEGRIFEYITKLQKQVKLGPTSRFDTLLRAASDEMKNGTSAIREQQSVLTGLIAQWEVFKNKIKAAAITVGERALYGLTRALISLGDVLSRKDVVEAFAASVTQLTQFIGGIASAVTNAVSVLTPAWSQLFDAAQVYAVILALEKFRSLVKSVGAASLPTSFLTPTGGAGNGLREKSAIELLKTARDSYNASLQASKDRIQAVATAQLQAISVSRRLAAANTVVASSTATATRFEALAASSRARAKQISAQTTAQLTVIENAFRQYELQREQAHQAALAQIRGSNKTRRQQALENQYQAQKAADTAAYNAALQHDRDVAAQRIRIALEESRRRAAVARAASATAQATSLTLPVLNQDNVERQAELAKAILEQKTKSLRGRLAAIFSLDPAVGRLGSAIAQLSSYFAGYSTATTLASKSSILFSGSLRTIGAAAVLAAKGVGLAVRSFSMIGAVLLRFAKIAGWVYFLYEIGEALLKATGLTDKFVASINKAITAVNGFTGLKIPTIQTNSEGKAKRQEAEALADAVMKANIEAEKFNRSFGSINIAAPSLDKVSTSLNNLRARFIDTAKVIQGSLKFNVETGDRAFRPFVDALQTISQINAKQAQTEVHLKNESRIHAEISANIVAKKNALEEAIKQAGRYAVELEKAKAESAARPVSLPGDDSKQTAAAKKLEDADRTRIALQEELASLQKRAEESTKRQTALYQQGSTLATGYKEILLATVSALNPSAWREFFGSGDAAASLISQLQEINTALERQKKVRDEAQSKLGMATSVRDSGQSPEEINKLTDEYQQAEYEVQILQDKLTALKDRASETDTALAFSKNKQQREQMVTSLITNFGSVSKAIGEINKASVESGTTVYAQFKGLATVVASASDYASQLGRLAVAREARIAYQQVAEAAKAAADSAKTAVSGALAKTKSDLDQLRSSAVDVMETLRKNAATARLTQENRSTDRYAERRINEINIEREAELKLLDVMKEQYALDDRTMSRKRLDINQFYDQKVQRVQDQTSDTKAKAEAKEQLKLFKELSDEATKVSDQMATLAQKMADLSISPADRAKLTGTFQEAADRADALFKKMIDVKGTIAGIQTSSGAPIIPKSEIDALQEVITKITEVKNAANQRAAGSQESLARIIESSANQGVKAAQEVEAAALKSIAAIVEASGTGFEKVYQDMARLYQSPAFKELADTFRTMAAGGAANIGSVSFDLAKFQLDLSSAREKAKEILGSVPLALDTRELPSALKNGTELFRQQLSAAFSSVIAESTGTKVQVGLTPEDGAGKKLADKVGNVEIPVTLVSQQLIGPTGATIQSGAAHAEGGLVRGPGTSTSDSIMAWLSNREYVSDAYTTAFFGEKFFDQLKTIARSGSLDSFNNLLSPMLAPMSLPVPVALPAPVVGSAGSSGAEALYSLDLHHSGKPVGRVVGSRATVDTLVKAIRDLSRGL